MEVVNSASRGDLEGSRSYSQRRHLGERCVALRSLQLNDTATTASPYSKTVLIGVRAATQWRLIARKTTVQLPPR